MKSEQSVQIGRLLCLVLEMQVMRAVGGMAKMPKPTKWRAVDRRASRVLSGGTADWYLGAPRALDIGKTSTVRVEVTSYEAQWAANHHGGWR